jgi:hypothetical protein
MHQNSYEAFIKFTTSTLNRKVESEKVEE